jgi:hypothetical protein
MYAPTAFDFGSKQVEFVVKRGSNSKCITRRRISVYTPDARQAGGSRGQGQTVFRRGSCDQPGCGAHSG